MRVRTQKWSNLYYGWWIAGELAITQTVTWGILFYTFSVFITPMEADFGWSRGTITGAFSAALLVSGAMAIPVGYWLDKHGARLLMTGGVTIASLLVVAWANVHNVIAFYAIWIGIGITMSAVLYEPSFAVIAKWFIRHRGRALALVTFAAGFASTIFIPLANWLLERYGWRDATLILAAILATATIPLHGLILRRKPADLGLQADGGSLDAIRDDKHNIPSSVSLHDALHDTQFWWLTTAFSTAYLAGIAIRVHLFPLLLGRGYEPGFVAATTGSIGAMQVLGRVIFAPVESRISLRVLTAAIFILQTISFVILIFVESTMGVYLFVVVYGASYGAQTLARPAIIADFYGSEYYGRISSVMAVFLTGATTIAPVGAGIIYTINTSYTPVLWTVLAISLLPIAAIMFVKQPKKKNVSSPVLESGS